MLNTQYLMYTTKIGILLQVFQISDPYSHRCNGNWPFLTCPPMFLQDLSTEIISPIPSLVKTMSNFITLNIILYGPENFFPHIFVSI